MRVLIVGGGRRGLDLAEELIGEGHAARVVTRGGERVPAIRAIGAEPWTGDPDRIGTLRYALHRSVGDPTTLLMYEQYADQAAVDAHGTSARIQQLFGTLGPLIDGQPSIGMYVARLAERAKAAVSPKLPPRTTRA